MFGLIYMYVGLKAKISQSHRFLSPWVNFEPSPLSTLSYLPTPLLGQDMTQGQFLSGV